MQAPTPSAQRVREPGMQRPVFVVFFGTADFQVATLPRQMTLRSAAPSASHANCRCKCPPTMCVRHTSECMAYMNGSAYECQDLMTGTRGA